MLKKLLVDKKDFRKNGWLYQGIGWAMGVFLILEVFLPLRSSEPIVFTTWPLKITVWLISGIIYGFTMKKVFHE